MTSSRSQIVATIGPKSGTKDVLREMVRHHMDVMRLNLSWGTHEEHAAYIEALRAVATEMGAHIPVIFDLAGPRKQTTTGHQFDASQYKPEKGLLTAKDTEDIRFGLSKSVEYVCVSYVGRKEDVEEAKGKIAEFGGTAKVIAKIERKCAVERADEIIAAADAVMIGRGDLGAQHGGRAAHLRQGRRSTLIGLGNGRADTTACKQRLSQLQRRRAGRDVALAKAEEAAEVGRPAGALGRQGQAGQTARASLGQAR